MYLSRFFELAYLLLVALARAQLGTGVFSRIFHVPFLDVLASRSDTVHHPDLGWYWHCPLLAVLCTAPSAVLELARMQLAELASLQDLRRHML